MANVSLTVPEELKAKMDKFQWINWSEVAREEAIKREMLHEDFWEFNRIVSKSKLTEKDAMRLAKEVNEGMYRKLEKQIYCLVPLLILEFFQDVTVTAPRNSAPPPFFEGFVSFASNFFTFFKDL